ncbi:hypothetical protein [Mycoplana sp. MJR14]|nr:hypothetical protein [Mycoplana sp. MJR14]MDF1634015.1 hypothetical protein [Mycoplana sp. MJR14]
MTALMMFFAILISSIFTIDFSRTIQALRQERIAIKAMRRKAGGFDV